MPSIESIRSLHGASIFSSLDLKSGLWQTVIDEKDRHKTAFGVERIGIFQFIR
jgi:hypothetical protein